MIKKIICLGVVLVMCLVLIACTKDEEDEDMDISFSVGYENLNVGYLGEHDLSCIVKTRGEWERAGNTLEYLSSLDDEYSEEFFTRNSLIVYTFTKGWGINKAEVVKITKKGNELTVEVKIELGIMEVMSDGILIIEVAITDIASATTLSIIET